MMRTSNILVLLIITGVIAWALVTECTPADVRREIKLRSVRTPYRNTEINIARGFGKRSMKSPDNNGYFWNDHQINENLFDENNENNDKHGLVSFPADLHQDLYYTNQQYQGKPFFNYLDSRSDVKIPKESKEIFY